VIAYLLDDDFAQWKAQKRNFTRDEVVQGIWIKIADQGLHFFVKFHANGIFSETQIFNPKVEVEGRWQLVGAVLRMNVQEYELDIFANKEGSIHSGIEFYGGRYVPTAYFKVIHLV
jgi:hypothetical protein